MIQHKRTALLAAGQVQGVGFRPFIYRLAVEGGLSGSVGNTSDGVRIEVQGPPEQVDAFAVRLRRELPPLARLTRLEITELPPVDGETEFVIVASHGHAGHSVLVSPDVGICEDCLRDMHTPGNPRFGYAFTNCTNCGPRYTITRSIPYDRATTSMACFPFCPRCEAEYRDPLDRRFHAQPVACPQCGPRLWLVDNPLLPPGGTRTFRILNGKRISLPSRTIIFADSRRTNSEYSGNHLSYHSGLTIGFSNNHGQGGNIAYFDGHVAASTPREYGNHIVQFYKDAVDRTVTEVFYVNQVGFASKANN